MRKIKFRAWDRTRSEFHWGSTNLMLDLNGTKFWQFAMDAPTPISIQDNYVLQQWTGLVDEDGKEIYEGDILFADRYPFVDEGVVGYRAVVQFIGGGFFRTLVCTNKNKRGISDGISDLLEADDEGLRVIGNVYENSELLEKK